MRDGINAAKLGVPAVALVTEEFWAQGDFVANSLGMPEVPRLKIPHPLAGTGEQRLSEVARQITPDILSLLEQK